MHLGPDHAGVYVHDVDQPSDEIAEYWDVRYLSAGEAAWRILGFHMTMKSPGVTSLLILLPNTSSHFQYYCRDGSASTMSKLDRYFARPAGFFQHDNILILTISLMLNISLFFV